MSTSILRIYDKEGYDNRWWANFKKENGITFFQGYNPDALNPKLKDWNGEAIPLQSWSKRIDVVRFPSEGDAIMFMLRWS